MEHVMLGDRPVGDGCQPYFIAEIGSNHNGDMDLCVSMIDAAKAAGAHAVKFQSWSSESLVSAAEYRRNTSYADTKRHFGSLRDMVERYQFTPEQHRLIAQYCADTGVTFASSAFSAEEIALLEELEVPFHKVASMDINNLPLLKLFGATQKPILLSTGMATIDEIKKAIGLLQQYDCPIVVLHCVSLYPPPDNRVNLRNIDMLRDTWGMPVGFSDHTLGTEAAVAAVARGACIIEKHFTTDADMEGWDHRVSATPEVFADMVRRCDKAYAMLGSYERTVCEEEHEKRIRFRRSAVAKQVLPRGTRLSEECVCFKRAGIADGISPANFAKYIGAQLRTDIEADEPIHTADVMCEDSVPQAT